MKVARFLFEKMTSLEHIFLCWDQFKRGKRKRKDIQFFERHLEDNIFQLQQDLIILPILTILITIIFMSLTQSNAISARHQ